MPPALDNVRSAIEQFLASASQPILIEAGDVEIPLVSGSYSIELSTNFLHLHAWNENRNYSRRVISIHDSKPGRISLRVIRFGQPHGLVTILDAAHARNTEIRRRGRREAQRERFRFMLTRQYPGWKIAELSTAPDLEHSLSPAYPRALLKQGTSSIAAICAPEDSLDPDGALTFGLIWLDYLRRRESKLVISSLALFLPEERSVNTALRLRYLDAQAAQFVLYLTNAAGEQCVDPTDWGNLSTRLEQPPPPRILNNPPPEAELEQRIRTSIRSLDAALEPEPVYRQAPAIAASDRGILDLLAIDFQGRLAVLELKASQDIHLPLQALDYWMRVDWHLKQGDFPRLGYFLQKPPISTPPLLYLVAPALEFHPTTDTLLRFLSPAIPVIRLGLGANWRCDLKVISRQERHEHSSATA